MDFLVPVSTCLYSAPFSCMFFNSFSVYLFCLPGNTLGNQPAERYKLVDKKTGKPLKSGETTQ
jgi:hypothetical protein